MIYTYLVEGAAADKQTWECRGTLTLDDGDWGFLMDRIMSGTFHQLTQGKAKYGYPGVGCRGPYSISKVTIEEKKNDNGPGEASA